MKKLLIILALLSLTTRYAMCFAQNNDKVTFYNVRSEYKKASTLSKVVGILSIQNQKLGIEDKSLFPMMAQAVSVAAQNVYRLNVRPDSIVPANPAPGSYALESVVTDLMGWTGAENGARVDVRVKAVEVETGKILDETVFCCSEVWASLTKAEGAAMVAKDVTACVEEFLWNVFPVNGSIVQKGVEQDNGKVKEKQCYIDLAENYSVYKGMKLGVYDGEVSKSNLIGTLKIVEVQGEELSVCTITKGNSKIEKLLKSGKNLTVSTKTQSYSSKKW